MATESTNGRIIQGNSKKPVINLFPKQGECSYVSCYCEENVYKLVEEVTKVYPNELHKCFVVFISNQSRTVPLWRQRAGKDEDRLVIWDYHVIFLYHPDPDKCLVYDLDSELPFPTYVHKYVTETFRTDHILKSDYFRYFRVIPAGEFIKEFASDRRHMKRPDGSWIKPPPSYPAISTSEPTPEIDDVGVGKYMDLCREMEIVPISRVIKSLASDTLDLKYYGLTLKQIKALTEALKPNTHVHNLIFQDNWLDVEMTALISDLIVENTTLQDLSLQECRIGEEGAEKLGNVLSGIQSLTSLNLSFNDLGDRGLLALQKGLCENTSLKKLNISHNNLSENSGEILEKILLENKYIDELDLSWSGFFTAQCNRKLFSAFMHTDRIKHLNLAWNGIGLPQATRPISKYLRKTENLEYLDISNNRLVGQSLRMIRTAIFKNHSLQILKMGNNIFPPEETHILLTALAGKAKDPLQYLDMENMYVTKESKPVLVKIKNIGKVVKIGGILSDYEIKGPNPRKLIYDRCRYILTKPKKPKARKDFGHFILSLPDRSVSPDEFLKELKKQKIKKLDKDLLQGVMDLFQTKKKEIDCPELIKDYMSFFPDTVLPPPKPKKGKKGKKSRKGKTEEKVIQVHDLETDPESTERKEDGEMNKNPSQPVLPRGTPSKGRLIQTTTDN